MFLRLPAIQVLLAVFLLGLLAPGGAAAQIRIGQTSGVTGPVASSVNEINAGARLLFDDVNRRGGIQGEKIEFISLDDAFQVPKAVENARKLIADPSIVALLLNRGTPHAQALMPLLTEGRIPLIAPSTGAAVLHTPVHPYIFNVRATYQLEAETIVRHLGLGGLEHVGVLYVADTFGEDAVQGAMRVFKAAGREPAVLMAIDRLKPDYAAAVQKILAVKPLGVLIIGAPSSVAAGVAALRAAGSAVTVATLSNNAAMGFVKELGANAKGVIVGMAFPSERRLSIPMIAEANRLAQAARLDHLTPAMVEGYAGAKVLVEGLKRASRERAGITRASLVAALETFDGVDIGGMKISFSPTSHTGLKYTDLAIIDGQGNFRR